jgi:hypothetical protein
MRCHDPVKQSGCPRCTYACVFEGSPSKWLQQKGGWRVCVGPNFVYVSDPPRMGLAGESILPREETFRGQLGAWVIG